MDQERQNLGKTSGSQHVAAAGIVIASTILLVLIGGYFLGWNWTGFAERTLWDWLNLLVVPAVLAVGGYLFTRSENRRAQEIAIKRARDDREIADQRGQDAILQSYLDQIGQLLLDKDRPLRWSEEGDEVQTLARARTLTVLSQLGGVRKGAIMRFLLEAGLITGGPQESREEKRRPVIGLLEADLSGVDLSTYEWSGIDMTAANLRDADLSVCGLGNASLAGADLTNAFVVGSFLRGTDLNGACLRGANFHGADMMGASLFAANLTDADFSNANLIGADLIGEEHRTNEDSFLGADLTNADFSGANLTDAKVTQEQLAQAMSLRGATMPDGSAHP